MMRNRIFAVLALAVMAGGGLAYGTYNAINSQPVKTVNAPTQPVVVAAADLPLGTELKKEDLSVLNFPAGSAPEGSFSKPTDLIGRGLIVSLVKNEPVIPGKLASKEAGAGLPPTITPGMRAISVKVNEVISVAGFVVPGTRVDVMTIIEGDDRNKQETMSRVVASNVTVLTSGTRYDQQEAKEGQAIRSTVVTLLVTPLDAERIALAQAEGQLMLTLRNPLDVAPTDSTGVNRNALFGAPAPAPVKAAPRRAAAPLPPPLPIVAPPKPYTVETIRAAKRTEEKLGER